MAGIIFSRTLRRTVSEAVVSLFDVNACSGIVTKSQDDRRRVMTVTVAEINFVFILISYKKLEAA